MSDVLPKIKGFFHKIEYPVIYFILVLFVTTEMLALFFPQVKELIKDKTGIFIFLALWLIFLYIAKHLEKLSEKNTLRYTSNFNDAMNMLFKDSDLVDEVDFFGMDGAAFFPAINYSNIKINKMNVLIRNTEDNVVYNLPISKSDQEGFRSSLRKYLEHWVSLINPERVAQYKIKAYDFEPTFVVVIVDGNRGFFGFVKHISKFPYHKVEKY
ncbi:MAG: hypothetical protein ACUZ77_03150, partial [Candidatus Brocadiales bacterium]